MNRITTYVIHICQLPHSTKLIIILLTYYAIGTIWYGGWNFTLACESIRAEIWSSSISWVSSSSKSATDVLKATAILFKSADMYGLKYYGTMYNYWIVNNPVHFYLIKIPTAWFKVLRVTHIDTYICKPNIQKTYFKT